MHISRTPFRISFFGGGTDYPEWYLREGGEVLSTTIDKYCYITCREFPPFFHDSYRIVWSHIENVSSISEILHPAVRDGLRMMGFEGRRGVEVHHQGDLPARAGMGSSSAFANGLLLALSSLLGKPFDKTMLFEKSIELEQKVLRDNVGSQDQVATAVGGFNIIRFGTDGGITVEPVGMEPERQEDLESRLMLFFTGTSRLATHIAKQVIDSLNDRAAELRRMRTLVHTAAGILRGNGGDYDDFGRLLHETWQLKRSISSAISNNEIDDIYDRARRAGALGGKLLGAGGSGFMLFYVPLERQAEVSKALSRLLNVPFRFENKGSLLINDGVGRELPAHGTNVHHLRHDLAKRG
ncbi:MAG: kinase [Alphaproteobacteria bacterium]|nr:kinase [Alphaproteobacteria bacterium]